MPAAIAAIIALSFVTLLLFAFFGGAWLYHRGAIKASPIPPSFIPKAKPKTVEPAKPVAPTHDCPWCFKTARYKFIPDKNHWTCLDCGKPIPNTSNPVGV